MSKNGIFETAKMVYLKKRKWYSLLSEKGLVSFSKCGNSPKWIGPVLATAFQKRKVAPVPQTQVADMSQKGSRPFLSKKAHLKGKQLWLKPQNGILLFVSEKRHHARNF